MTEHVRLVFDDEREIELPIDVTGPQLIAALARVFPEVEGPPARGHSLVLAFDREHWFQLSGREGALSELHAWRERARPGETVQARVAYEKVCMHGSPAVPFRGYACGWC